MPDAEVVTLKTNLADYPVTMALKDGRFASSVVTLLALAVFGGIKGRFTGAPLLRSSLQTCIIGGLAAAAAFAIARWIA